MEVARARPGETLADRFRILAEVSRGGMSVVYRAADRDTGQTVALKLVRARDIAAERFAREAALVAELSLSHPGIVGYVAHGLAGDGTYFLAQQWIEGQTLRERLIAEGFTTRESVEVARRVAEALAEAHRNGVVHRDVKPENLVFAGEDPSSIKVIDFGIARRTCEDRRLTATGTVLGTPGYMAPEQARGERDLDAGVDVFALGCVLYECLTGRAPFAGENLLALHAKVLFTEPPRLEQTCDDAPPELAALLARMLAKRRADRPAHAGEVARALAAIGPLAHGRRRPVDFHLAGTIECVASESDSAGAPLACVVLAGGVDDEEVDASARTGALRGAFADPDARVEALVDGALVAVLSGGEPAVLVDRAARGALELRARFPDVPVVISAPRGRPARGEIRPADVDWGAGAVETSAIHALFGGVSPGIRIDEDAARLLGDRYALRRERGAVWLDGKR